MLSKTNYRILIIDDIPSIHEDFKKILTPEQDPNYKHLNEMNTLLATKTPAKCSLPPFELKFAMQGEEGIAHVKEGLQKQSPFAVAFVDVQMPPGEDGIETISQIWKLDHEIQTVICTAYAKYTWEDLRKRFGDSDRLYVLKKPFDNLEIIQLACSLCKKWNLNRLHASREEKEKLPAETSPLNPSKTIERLNDAMNMLSEMNSKLKQPPPT